jgi:nucleoside-diphosphate-sugar epimerase
MKKVSILGCGWLGLPLGKSLVMSGYAVAGSTTRSEKLISIQEMGMRAFIIDLQNGKPDSQFFNTDTLIVTIPPGSADKPENYLDYLDTIKAASKKGAVKNTLYISSSSVYPELCRDVNEEDASETALTRSGISLLQAENKLKSDVNTILRFSGLIGPDRHPGKWFGGKRGLKGAKNPVNMIHLEDCIGVIKTILAGNHWGDVFNACAPEHPTKKEYYQRMAQSFGSPPPEYSEDDETKWKIVSSRHLVEKTGYQFKKSIFSI